MTRSARFYLARLRNASVPELLYRAGQCVFMGKLKRDARRGAQPEPSETAAALVSARTLQPPVIHGTTDPALVAAILGGHRFTLNSSTDQVRRCEEALRGRFFADIGETSCDIRAVWEPARLQHLTYVAVHAQRSCSEAERDAIRRFMTGEFSRWLDDNPFPLGPHYMSAMECGLRMPVFLLGIRKLAGVSDVLAHRLLGALYRHGWLIYRRLSLHSSLGNHTVAEALGLIFAGAVFRGEEEGSRWLDRGIELLRGEINHQILADGGPVEQSLAYHRFVLDMYWLAVNFLTTNRLHDAGDLTFRLAKGEEFLAAFRSGESYLPSIGDSDDGHAVAPGLRPKRCEIRTREERLRVFKSAGYSVLRSSTGTVITFDHGPLGMAPLHNHGHADALSITLTRNGEPLLVDPGTCRYNGAPQWRSYFKGTSAHNTVTVDGRDQAFQETGFVWSRPYNARLERVRDEEDGILLEASHGGYCSLGRPVLHRRTLCWIDDEAFVVEDRFEGKGEHEFLLTFHLHPEAVLRREANWWVARKGNESLWITLVGGGDFCETRARGTPPLGWFSPAYGQLRDGSTLEHRTRAACADTTFITLICTGEPIAVPRAEERLWNMKAVV